MERIDKTDKSFQFFFGAGCGSKTIIYVAAKKFWFGTIELIENLFFRTLIYLLAMWKNKFSINSMVPNQNFLAAT